MTETRKKVAILGGGVGAMTTAFAITSQPDWQKEYDVTVYQLGWRLGGKGASGRGPQKRIEEHGLHIWIGCYDNAFKVMQDTYRELNRPGGSPLAGWQDAFKKHSFNVVAERFEDKWYNWTFNFPENDQIPGQSETPIHGDGTNPSHIDPDDVISLWPYIRKGLKLLVTHVRSASALHLDPPGHHCALPAWMRDKVSVPLWLHDAVDHAHDLVVAGEIGVGMALLNTATKLIDTFPHDEEQHREGHLCLSSLLKEFIAWLRSRMDKELAHDSSMRHLWTIAELGIAMICGILEDGVLSHPDGLDCIDHYDFREWLALHGAEPEAVNSHVVQALYDLVFGYVNGDTNKPNFAAGAGTRSILRVCFTYKGAIFWKMQAGMGDVVFGPLYEVLARRGVNFKFFSRVTNLGLHPTTDTIDTITIEEQMTVRPDFTNPITGKAGDYYPLEDVKGLPCWPSQPLYDQLVKGEALDPATPSDLQNRNLESFWTDWHGTTKTLTAGVDFDTVVLGIPVGSFPYICPELGARSPRWQKMVDNVLTTQTMGMQLWFDRTLEGMGWPMPSPVIDAYVEPWNTWADMTYLVAREDWPADCTPLNLAYLCGNMLGPVPASLDPTIPAQELEKVKKSARDWLRNYPSFWWPKASDPNNPNGLDLSLLSNVEGGDGEARFNAQYLRANIDPSERYVLSVKGSTEYRLRANDSGFGNLVLAGDWIQNDFNAGCVEAAVMSGLQASNAVCGCPPLVDIVGQHHP